MIEVVGEAEVANVAEEVIVEGEDVATLRGVAEAVASIEEVEAAVLIEVEEMAATNVVEEIEEVVTEVVTEVDTEEIEVILNSEVASTNNDVVAAVTAADITAPEIEKNETKNKKFKTCLNLINFIH